MDELLYLYRFKSPGDKSSLRAYLCTICLFIFDPRLYVGEHLVNNLPSYTIYY